MEPEPGFAGHGAGAGGVLRVLQTGVARRGPVGRAADPGRAGRRGSRAGGVRPRVSEVVARRQPERVPPGRGCERVSELAVASRPRRDDPARHRPHPSHRKGRGDVRHPRHRGL